MKRTGIVVLLVILTAGAAIGQTPPLPSVNVLGPHNVSGRGCLSCHPPSSAASAIAAGESAPDAASPWGPSTLPLYGKAIAFGDGGRFVEVFPADISIRNREVSGILVCLSCHDGNLSPPSMMVGQSFEQRVGLLPVPAYGGQPIPTLIGVDNYANDHPVGTAAVIRSGEGLVWADNTFSVTPGSPYYQFVAHYGRPALAPGRSSNPWGVNSSGQPFVLCITCHNQHVMSVYTSSPSSQIGGDGGGRSYPTFFFINAPYDPRFTSGANSNAGSTTQFCRQCHFTDSNEANNASRVLTRLQNF